MKRPAIALYPLIALGILFAASCDQPDPNLHPDHVVRSVSTGEGIYVLSPTPGGTRLYVSRDAGGDEAWMMIQRAKDYAVLDSFRCGVLPLGMLFLPNGKYLYVADDPFLDNMGKVWVVDVATSRVVKEIPTNRNPGPLAATPDSRFLYVGSWANDEVLVVRTEDNVVVDTIGFPEPAVAVAVSPDGSRLYVSARKMYVLRTSDYVVIDSIAVGRYAGELAILPDGNRLYASAAGDSGLLYAISLPENTVEDSVVVGRRLEEDCALPGSRFVYTSSPYDSSVYVIRTSDDSVVDRIPVGLVPARLTAHPDGSRVYVTAPCYSSHQFVVLGY